MNISPAELSMAMGTDRIIDVVDSKSFLQCHAKCIQATLSRDCIGRACVVVRPRPRRRGTSGNVEKESWEIIT